MIGRGIEIEGLEYQMREVANMMSEKESAVNSSVVIGKPILTRCISVTKNQKAWKTVMMRESVSKVFLSAIAIFSISGKSTCSC